ncbi:hypothetical protein MHYP_G00191430 [Metynnis hypsauchen]
MLCFCRYNHTSLPSVKDSEDEGIYEEKTFSHGRDEKLCNITLSVLSPPAVIKIAVSTSRCPLTLRCEVRGEFLNLRWLRDELPLPEDQRISFNETNRTMRVSCLNASDWGTYTCQVSNGAGTSEAQVKITSDLGTGKGTVKGTGEKEIDLILILCCTGGTLTAILTLCIILFYTCKCECECDEPLLPKEEADTSQVDFLPYINTDLTKLKASQQITDKRQPAEDFTDVFYTTADTENKQPPQTT